MYFGRNLQFLRKMRKGMSQEELAERMEVSRQTVSKWEQDAALPTFEKAAALCKLFSCTLDELLVQDLCSDNKAYSNIRTEETPPFRYIRYAVISEQPEDDALNHIRAAAKRIGIERPDIIGWDFPFVSQEQINVHHMHGYAAACILPEGVLTGELPVHCQNAAKYAAITIEEPSVNAFVLIPNAYKTLMRYMESNGLVHKESGARIPCFEREYARDGKNYMDVYIAYKE